MTTSTEVFSAALAAEHAAIWGYGVVGAHLDDKGKQLARQAETSHRTRRDALIVRLAGASPSATPVPLPVTQPGYQLPFKVTNKASAYKLAVALEEGTARAWRQALAATAGAERKLALDALADCAVRATRWRRAAKINPPTIPFPGASR